MGKVPSGDAPPGSSRKRGMSPEAESAKRRCLPPDEEGGGGLCPEAEAEAEAEAGPHSQMGGRIAGDAQPEAAMRRVLCPEAEAGPHFRAEKMGRILGVALPVAADLLLEEPIPIWDEPHLLEPDALQDAPAPAPPEMRHDDQDEAVTEKHGAPVDELTKAVETEEKELSSSSSFTLKSPISKPYIPDEMAAHPETLAAFQDALAKYKAKLRRRSALFSSEHKRKAAPSCLFHHDHLHPIREPAKKAVLRAAKSVIRLSSSVDGEPLTNCCGLWTDWDEESKTGIILTTAHLIRSNHPTENHWKCRDEYDVKANVTVHLRDGTTAEGHYLYHQEHYDLAFFQVRVVEPVQLISFSDSVHCGQDIFRLGRDESMNLRITHGRVEYWNPASYERYHYMYFLHEDDNYLCDDDGGPVIDLDGKVVGLINNHLSASFVPSFILDKCVDLWRKFRCIPRLHLGMKFASIGLLDPIHVEKMWRMHNIEDGLIVEKVSKESHAEKLRICFGDIIECFNGKRVSTTVELENMLLDSCKDHFAQGNKLNTKIDVSIQVFHTDEHLRRTINLNVEVSDHGEVVRKSTYPITPTERTYATVQSSQNVAGLKCLTAS